MSCLPCQCEGKHACEHMRQSHRQQVHERLRLYVQDVLKHLGASEYGSLPVALGQRSPRESYNPEADNFSRVRGSYQNPPEHP